MGSKDSEEERKQRTEVGGMMYEAGVD